jgi:phage terminase small subunit
MMMMMTPTSKPNERALTPKQQGFLNEYLIDGNATQACLRAGYRVTAANAGKVGPRLLADPRIQAAITARRSKAAKSQGLTVERIMHELEDLATAAKGSKQHSAAIRAYELLGKQLGMFVDKSEQRQEIHIIWEDAGPLQRLHQLRDARQAAALEDRSVEIDVE